MIRTFVDEKNKKLHRFALNIVFVRALFDRSTYISKYKIKIIVKR